MISYWALTTHLKVFDMANLLDRSVILLNLPVLVMDCIEIIALKRYIIWQVNHVVAVLVFLHRPKQADLTKIFEPYIQTIIWNLQILNLLSLTFFQ